MCGILALISLSNKNLDQDTFSKALKEQRYRGPDGSKVVQINSSCLFGFNRLAIQDLTENSMQPFSYQGNWLIFNGEIYNYIELRRELQAKGATFRTTGDAEVLAVGLTREGRGFINKLNGIFAFCFYDIQSQTYLVARDRLGVKPLFYFRDNERLIFSSEIKSILKYTQAELNWDVLFSHVFLDWFIGYRKNETFFQNIKVLENGSYRIYDQNGSLSESPSYYKPDFATEIVNFQEIESEFPKLVERTFEWETRSDAKVGIAMSGGIDTSTILTLATPHLIPRQDKIPVFTFYYTEKGENTDLSYVRKIIPYLSKKYGDVFEVHEYNMDKAILLTDFEEAVRARETPVFDIRYITITKLYREVRKTGIKVALSGQGSDEVFYGYYPLDYWLSRFYREGVLNALNVLDYFENTLNSKKQPFLKSAFLSKSKKSSEEHLLEIFEKLPQADTQQKLLTALFRETILPSFMLYEDKFGMYSGLEIRVPMINPLLVEYIDKCDYKVNLISSNAGRHLFRNILKGKLPEEVVFRGKTPTPKKKKYLDELFSIIRENSDSILNSELLDQIYKKQFLKGICQGKNRDSLTENLGPQSFYGGIEDALVELLGLYSFERVYLQG